jgi:hypothetical protein
MRFASRIVCAVSTIAILVGTAASAHAQSATFSRIDDATASRFFDPATTRPDAVDRNKLIIGFHRGLDAATFKSREFKASTAAFSNTSALDTISFRIQAPAGYYIATVTYTQRGSGSVLRTGKASGGGTWTVADVTSSLATFTTAPTLTRVIDLSSRRLTTAPVSITTSLFAFATTSLGSANVSITSADVKVKLAKLP